MSIVTRTTTNTFLFAASLAAAAALSAQPAAAARANLQAYCSRHFPNSMAEVMQTRYGPRMFCRRPGATGGFSRQPVSATEVCSYQSTSGQFRVSSGRFHCTGQNLPPPSMLGTWRLKSPIYIVNQSQCGSVRYTSRIVITRRVGAGHYVGVNYFNWDPSGLRNGCTFRKSGPGQVAVNVHVRGNRVTIKYRRNGRHNFADDNLRLLGSFMQGRDKAGQWIVFTKVA